MLTTHESGADPRCAPETAGASRFLGIDVGAETLKIVELRRASNGSLVLHRWDRVEHGKKPEPALIHALAAWDWDTVTAAAVSGRFSSRFRLPRIPAKQAQLKGWQFFFGEQPATIVNIGSQGYSVLEVRPGALSDFRENNRCSQGTGNFLRQLVERFSLSVEEAGVLCAGESHPAVLSGRCPVILKTDMTHLANRGEDRTRILAGLFDAVCENVLLLVKPGDSPRGVLLAGGVSQAPRVRRFMSEALAARGMELLRADDGMSLCLEAFGCAVAAAEAEGTRAALVPSSAMGDSPEPLLPGFEELVLPPPPLKLDRLPALSGALSYVRRLPPVPFAHINGEVRRLVLGFDIGSTGSKVVALDLATKQVVWEGYRQTLGDPVGAAQDLLRQFTTSPAGACPVHGFGATGSGREIVGSLLTSCFGKEAVFVVNEIVAHATGALHFDPRVDTIFEIGGQDAKYIRLAEGRVIDCAMNEACSAGTGSFIEEQGRKFSGVRHVSELGRLALGAPAGVSLGQHCSVFMAEVIDEAVAAGAEQPAILSGLYDSIIKNYLNRVKGNRSVGRVIFCQGMPFSADALAAAVARETGSRVVVPPNPGTIGALGIALLATRELGPDRLPPLEPRRFLEARVEQKDSFVCRSTSGCGGAGNRCRIDRLRTVVETRRSAFTWGGGCALHDKATRKRKLPDRAPDPFREREELLRQVMSEYGADRGRPAVAMTDEFMLKGLLPFFAAFFYESGFDVRFPGGADHTALKRGIQLAPIPFCAPMQMFHGVAEKLLAAGTDRVFVPLLRSLPPIEGQPVSGVCPIVQAGPDLLRTTFGNPQDPSGPGPALGRLLAPMIDFGRGGMESVEFKRSCGRLAAELGLSETVWQRAFSLASQRQHAFDAACLDFGRRALEFCRERNLAPVVVLGRAYTIYNTTLNSNVPAILREQGAIGIPVDCYPVREDTPRFPNMFWAYGHQVLRAAHQVRRSPGEYALYCSNYSCGPDSFNLHFAGHAMEGKPFAVIETDGHSGDAGTRTRVEAFLHCVEEHRGAAPGTDLPTDFSQVQPISLTPEERRKSAGAERVLVPYMGPASEVVNAILCGLGFRAEALPAPDAEAMRLGRRYTSGKECLPLPLTLGTLLQRLEKAGPEERFLYLQPRADGPCRFGAYNLLNRIVLDRLGYAGRVRIWSPKDNNYFEGMPAGTEALAYAGMVASDLLVQARLDVRPVETLAGAADRLYEAWHRELLERVERAARSQAGMASALWQVASGKLFGFPELLDQAGAEAASVRGREELPTVELTGEIYVRAVEFSNDSLARKLEARGLRVQLVRMSEWLAYCNYLNREAAGAQRWSSRLGDAVQERIERALRGAIAPHLAWEEPHAIPELLAAADPYVSRHLLGEAGLTVGGALLTTRARAVDAVVNVGPLECMPSKIAEAQFHYLSRRDGLLSVTLPFDGSPVNEAVLDNFAYEVRARFQRGRIPEVPRERIQAAPVL